MRRTDRYLSVNYHYLHLTPVQLLLRKAYFFSLLCFFVLKKKDSNEEVEEEEATNENKDDEEDRLLYVVLKFGPVTFLCDIHGLVHDAWPTFKRRDDEECHHSFNYVIEVGVVA